MNIFDKHAVGPSRSPPVPRQECARICGLPTLGGRHLWADELFFHGWHIQHETPSRAIYRLLDETAIGGYAWGTLERCRATLDRIRVAGAACRR